MSVGPESIVEIPKEATLAQFWIAVISGDLPTITRMVINKEIDVDAKHPEAGCTAALLAMATQNAELFKTCMVLGAQAQELELTDEQNDKFQFLIARTLSAKI